LCTNSSALDHLARIDRGVIDGTDLLHLVGDQLVLLVEKQVAKLLLVGERHAAAAIVDHLVPGRERDAALDLAFGDAAGCRCDQLELVDGAIFDAVNLAQPRFGRVDNFRERAELLEQHLRERLGVTARDRREQRHFQ
jgi:hypothetical protein